MSENDFLSFVESQPLNERLKSKYKIITMHFFLDPGSFNTLNLKKYLVDYLCAINYGEIAGIKINVNIYFDNNALKTNQNLDLESLNSNDYKLIKY